MRAVALHADVLVVTSRVWQTTCTLVRGGEEAFVIDSPVYPDELEILPALMEQAQFTFSGLLATHADFDHLLGRMAFPGASLGCAESSARRLAAEPGGPQRELREFDERHYVRRDRPLGLGQVQSLPVPGRCAVGDRELELHPADGHTPDGMAILAPWAGVLICGDYLSAVELPTLSDGGSLGAYRATLDRLEGLLSAQVTHVVCGHGPVLDAPAARRVLGEDRAYLEALGAGGDARLPEGRSGAQQQRLHEANMARLAG